MKRLFNLLACFVSTVFPVLAFAQSPSTQQGAVTPTSATPSAYVYMINQLSNGTSELDGYSADSTGALTRLPGSPFWKTSSSFATGLANTAHWLFASDGVRIYSFSVASSGALKQVSSINAQQYTGGNCGEVTQLFLDHTGATLYAVNFDSDCANNTIQAFAKNSSTGALTYLGDTSPSVAANRLAFLGNNKYGYNASCIQLSASWYAVTRSSDGTLARFLINPPIPTNPNGNYCPAGDAADPASNLAVAFMLEEQPPAQLGVYTADGFGNLTTNSTQQNMPSAAVGFPHRLLASPAGNILAIAGDKGMQLFHFNGSNPITSYSGLLTAHATYDLAWDSHNHLYAIGSGLVNAFNVTTTGYKQASGSPYAINAIAITVVSK